MRPNEMNTRPLSIHELGFVDLSVEKRPQSVCGVAFLDSSFEFELLRERLINFIASNPQLQCKINTELSCWEDDPNFQIENHCIDVNLNFLSKTEVLTWLANRNSHPLEKNCPPWQILRIRFGSNNSADKQSYAFALLAHHSLVDGLVAFDLFEQLTDKRKNSEKKNAINRADTKSSRRRFRFSGSCAKAVVSELFSQTITSPFSGKASRQRTAICLEWPRSRLRSIRRNLKASFQEVILIIISAGLKNYCNRHGHLNDLRSVLPLGRPNETSESFDTNRHDIGTVQLPIKSEGHGNMLRRLRGEIEKLKVRQRKGAFVTFTRFLERVPRALRKLAVHRWAGKANLLISLIPGGTRSHRVGGAQVNGIFALPALPPGHALSIGIIPQKSSVSLALHLDPEIIMDSALLQKDFEDAYRSFPY